MKRHPSELLHDSSEDCYVNISTESRNLSILHQKQQLSVSLSLLGAKPGNVQYKVIRANEKFQTERLLLNSLSEG